MPQHWDPYKTFPLHDFLSEFAAPPKPLVPTQAAPSRDFLKEELAGLAGSPEAAYFSFQDQFEGAPTQQRYFQGQFKNIFNRYLGELGQRFRQGDEPENTFADFLGNYNFGQQFSQLSPSVRGATTSRFAPPARFLNF